MNTSKSISIIIEKALINAQKANELPKINLDKITVEKPRNKSFGNWSSNIALVLSKEIKKNPIDLAKILSKNIDKDPIIESVEILTPGFINFRLSKLFRTNLLNKILDKKTHFGTNSEGKGKKSAS